MKHDIRYLIMDSDFPPMIELKVIPSLIMLVLVGIVYAVHSVWFLSLYYRLRREERQTKGVIVSFDQGVALFFRIILVPVVRFQTENDSVVEGLPKFSSFMRLNILSRQQAVRVYYQADNPTIFVIASETELEAHWAMIGFMGCVLVGLLVYWAS